MKTVVHVSTTLLRTTVPWDTAGGEISVPSVKNTEPTCVFLLKPGAGQNIAMHASPATI